MIYELRIGTNIPILTPQSLLLPFLRGEGWDEEFDN